MNKHTNTNTKVTQRGARSRDAGGKPMNVRTGTLAALGIAGVLGLASVATAPERGETTVGEKAAIASMALRADAATVSADVIASVSTDAAISIAGHDAAQTASVDIAATAFAGAAGAPRAAAADSKAEHGLDAAAAAKMSGRLARIAAAGGNAPVEVVVSYADHPELFDDARVAELGGEVVRSYTSLAMRAIRVPAGSLNELALETRVDRLSLDTPVHSVSESARITANVPEGAQANAVFEGAGIGVAIIDSGVSKHSVLADGALQFDFTAGQYPVPVIVDGQISVANDVMRDDKFGHGTHVAATVAGAGADSAGEYQGASPGAQIVALQVLDHKGAGQMSDVIAALDWLLVYGHYFDVRVVNLSLGQAVSQSNRTDPLVLAAEALWDAGVVVVAAAGNDGYNGNFTINSPGNSRKIITVGSLTYNGTGTDTTDDYVSSFSSRGPSVGDMVLKPDLVAPGNKIVAAVANGAELKKLLPNRVKGCNNGSTCAGIYLELSGTSMATPLVAGAAARMLAKDPTLSPDTIKARLMRSARKVDGEPTSYGAGVLDVDAALSETSTVSGQALSPIMIRDEATNGILIEDTAANWGGQEWAAGYLYYSGFNWNSADGATTSAALDGVAATGFLWSDEVAANGFLWSDEGVWANGFLWSDEGGGGVWARGFLWSDEGGGTGARSLLDTDWETWGSLSDDP